MEVGTRTCTPGVGERRDVMVQELVGRLPAQPTPCRLEYAGRSVRVHGCSVQRVCERLLS
jgi:hypothetical protein